MRASINFFDEVTLNLRGSIDPEGTALIADVFATFADRPGAPHLTLRSGDRFDLHFTAFRDHPRLFRRRLIDLAPDRIADACAAIGPKLYESFAPALQPANLEQMAADGWRACGPRYPVLKRWARHQRRAAREVRVDRTSIESFVEHVVRSATLPTLLPGSLPYPVRLVALRWKEEVQDCDFQPLVYFPDGVWTETSGKPTQAYSPGWFTHRARWLSREDSETLFRTERAEKVVRQVEDYLGRFARRSVPKTMAEVDGMPNFASFVFGYYAGDLLAAVCAASVD
jgi:hypothetical protein